VCKKDFGEGNPSNICKLLKKGADKVNEASHKRGCDDVVAQGLRVHMDCRKWYTNERDIQTSLKRATEPSAPRNSMHVSEGPFNFRTDCLFFVFVYCTRRCTCRTYRLPCTSACGQCQVQSCSNFFNQMLTDENDDSDNGDNAEMIQATIGGDYGKAVWHRQISLGLMTPHICNYRKGRA